MATLLMHKYIWLVDTIYRAKRITFQEISRRWQEEDFSDGEKLALRTFHKWRIACEEIFGLVIECERCGGYHYYIENEAEIRRGGLRNWLLENISVNNLLLENQSLRHRILTEPIPQGKEYLAELLRAMKMNSPVILEYKGYWTQKTSRFDLLPYCVKQFRQRWYVAGWSPYFEQIRIYALDRISALTLKEGETFTLPTDFDAETYFSDYFGIVACADTPKQMVRLRVSAHQAQYLRSLPLHASQREVEQHDEYSIFELTLCPEFDFQMELRSMGADLEVESPLWLRDEMRETAQQMLENYTRTV